MPILLKDNIDTADRMTTTAGSLALEGSVPQRDSSVARALREAGAVLLGKTNLSEWANFRARPSSSGWSGRGGQCRNPYALDRSPCGSSSGSGVAAAASLCAAAIGTETDGSIVCPSSHCGLVGIKPTVGLVSRAGIIPISHSQDTAGPMTRTVADAAAVLSALTAADPRDRGHARPLRRPVHADYTAFLDAGALRGKRLGIARKFFALSRRRRSVDGGGDRGAARRRRGHRRPDRARALRAKLGESEQEVLLYEFKTDIAAYLGDTRPRRAGRARWTTSSASTRRTASARCPGSVRSASSPRRRRARSPTRRTSTRSRPRAAWRAARASTRRCERDRLDAIVAPTGGPAWTIDLVNGDHFGGGSSTHAAVAGYPNVTVPAGMVQGLPVGISFFAGAFAEGELISIAYAYEQATLHRRAPTFRASVEQG